MDLHFTGKEGARILVEVDWNRTDLQDLTILESTLGLLEA